MSRTNRFYLHPGMWGPPFTLEGSEAHHLTTVLRTPVGARVCLFDGQGREGVFRVTSCTKKRVLLEEQTSHAHCMPTTRTWIAPAWNRANKRGWFLEKAVELGAWGILYWQSDFSQGRVPSRVKETWTARCIAAAKQCANPWLPEITTYGSGLEGLLEATNSFANRIFLWEDPDCPRLLTPEDTRIQGDILIILGPEGGFSEKETEILKGNGCTGVSLGDRVLRWETAAVVCLGIAFWGLQSGSPRQSAEHKP
ncbi:16S rRNA (uracil(1498)-N(3))-methyltransferase [Desulfoplanes sp.]